MKNSILVMIMFVRSMPWITQMCSNGPPTSKQQDNKNPANLGLRAQDITFGNFRLRAVNLSAQNTKPCTLRSKENVEKAYGENPTNFTSIPFDSRSQFFADKTVYGFECMRVQRMVFVWIVIPFGPVLT